MPDLTPEQLVRQQIDAQLVAAGWVVQDYKQFNPTAGRGIALREVPLKSGMCDYLLLVERKAVGVVEAKKKGTLLSGVAEQSGHYAENLPDLSSPSRPAHCHSFTNPPASKPSSAMPALPSLAPAAAIPSTARRHSPPGSPSLQRSAPGSRRCPSSSRSRC